MDELAFKALLEKYTNGTCTPEETALLESWYKTRSEKDRLPAPETQELLGYKDLIWQDIAEKAGIRQPVPVTRIYRLWPRIAVAASIVLAMTVGGYFILHKQQPTQQIAQQKPDIQPGHNQATLTLASGKKIILTKGLSGKLAQQGQTVINANENNITYNAKNQPGDQVSYNTLTTAQGEQSPYPLVLADGTKVWLNAESSITFPTAFTRKERTVKITGEAYFEVAHNSQQPFKVEANGQTIEDIGTAFNVNAYANEPTFKTTLVEGSIKINDIILKHGQQARNTNGTIKVIGDVNTKVYTAWKDGYFRYELETLPEIMREFARWYKVEVVFATPPTDQQFNMKVSRKATLNRALQILANGGIRYKLEGNKLVINP